MKKVVPKYFILPRSITIIIGEKTYHISNDNVRYSEAIKAIEDGKLDDLSMIVDPTLRLGEEDFEVVDGLVKYKDQMLPSVLGDQFLKYKIETVSFLALVNFWMNLKYRIDFDKAKEKVVAMLSMNAYPLTSDGFVIVYQGLDNQWYDSSMGQDIEVPFFSYASCMENIQEQFESRSSLDQICNREFGFFTKKLNKLVLEKILNKKTFKIDDRVFKYGSIFKGVLSNENLVTFIEKGVFYETFGSMTAGETVLLNDFLKIFTEKKVINFFTKFKDQTEENQTRNAIHQVGRVYSVLVKNDIKIEDHRFQGFAEMFEYMQEEVYKLKFPIFDLNIENNFPQVKEITSTKIDELMHLIIPKTNRELRVWSNEMKNCIGDYGQQVLKGTSFVLAVANEKGLLFNIEIDDFKIRQFVKKGNISATDKEREPVISFLKKQGLLK